MFSRRALVRASNEAFGNSTTFRLCFVGSAGPPAFLGPKNQFRMRPRRASVLLRSNETAAFTIPGLRCNGKVTVVWDRSEGQTANIGWPQGKGCISFHRM